MEDTPGEAKVKIKTMNVGNIEINTREVTGIDYEPDTDLIVIRWEKRYTDKTATEMFAKVGSNAIGLKAFIQTVIERIEKETDDKITNFQAVLGKARR